MSCRRHRRRQKQSPLLDGLTIFIPVVQAYDTIRDSNEFNTFIRVIRTVDSNGSNTSNQGTLLFWIHAIFILLASSILSSVLAYLACQIQNSVAEKLPVV
jgi:hypothetical protein